MAFRLAASSSRGVSRSSYVELVALDPARSLVVMGTPGTHLGAVIAAAYLIRELDMRIVGEFTCDMLTPAAVSYQGLAVGPVQVWATDDRCGLDHECDRLLVVKADIPIPPAAMPSLADAITAWAKGIEASEIITLDELEVGASEDGISAVANAAGRLRVKALEVAWTPDTILTGLAASILTHADVHKIAAIALHAHRLPVGTDARSAARFIAQLATILPEIGVDPARLQADAASIESVVRALHRQQSTDIRMLEERALRGYA